MSDRTKFILILLVFLLSYYLPFGHPRLNEAILSTFLLLQDARHHVLLCLVPAFFIAGALSVFLSKEVTWGQDADGPFGRRGDSPSWHCSFPSIRPL